MGKFTNLYESAIQRFTRGGLLIGDLVKFKSDVLTSDFVKKQAVNYAQKIKEFIDNIINNLKYLLSKIIII
jgi:predicted O-methyltransferase YrrM